MEKTTTEQKKFLQNSLQDGGFLQSQEWLCFQEYAGRRTFHFEGDGCFANVIEYTLPWVGKYWYIPRGPVIASDTEPSESTRQFLRDIAAKARQESVGWIRIEPTSDAVMRLCSNAFGMRIEKAVHDMQPKEILVLSLDGNEETILSTMKSKTRYNIRLAQKKRVKVFTSHEQRYVDAFCDLVGVTAKRDGIVSHPRSYYQTMLQVIPDDMLKLYLAEYEGEIVAANLAVFFGTYATYLHGASDNEHREVMAPYLLQWRQMQDARRNGCTRYDFGGVKSESSTGGWSGITRFKQGFAPNQETARFMGSYDVVISDGRYGLYLAAQKMKTLWKNVVL